jgi:hypothetical protein
VRKAAAFFETQIFVMLLAAADEYKWTRQFCLAKWFLMSAGSRTLPLCWRRISKPLLVGARTRDFIAVIKFNICAILLNQSIIVWCGLLLVEGGSTQRTTFYCTAVNAFIIELLWPCQQTKN